LLKYDLKCCLIPFIVWNLAKSHWLNDIIIQKVTTSTKTGCGSHIFPTLKELCVFLNILTTGISTYDLLSKCQFHQKLFHSLHVNLHSSPDFEFRPISGTWPRTDWHARIRQRSAPWPVLPSTSLRVACKNTITQIILSLAIY